MEILFDKINIALIFVASLNFSLGMLIFFNGWKKKVNVIYALNIVAIVGWVIAMILFRSASNESNLFWCTVLYVTPTFIASSFLYFTYIFPSRKKKSIFIESMLFFIINLIVVIMIVWPGFIIKEVNTRIGLEKEIIFTQYYWFYFLYTLSFFTFGFYRLFKKYFKSIGIERLQILYLSIGYSSAANLAFVTNLIMPWIGYFFLNWLGQVFTCIMVGFTSYAILKYRLMDIRIIIRKLFIYLGMAGFVYGAFYLVIWIYNKFFGGVYAFGAYLMGIMVAPIFIAFFYLINKKLQIFANKYFFYSLYNYQETISKLTDELNYYINLDKIIDFIVDTIKQTMQLDKTGVLLINQKKGQVFYQVGKVIGFNEQNGISLVQDNFLTKYLKKSQKPLVRDELILLARDAKISQEKTSFNRLYKNMKRIEASLCLPLISSDRLIGIIVLGSKISGDAYTKEDLDILDTLSKQAAIAIENAKLYKEVQDLSQNLQQKVDEQTKEIREAYQKVEKSYEVEKKARKGLERLDKVKNQFMMATQHHLRTPLTSMMGYLDLLLGGSYGKMPQKIKDVFKKIKISTKNEINIVEDLLRISQFQLGKRVVTLQPNIKIEPILKEIIDEIKFEADKKGIYVKLEKLKKVFKIKADPQKLKVALFNIIDNAVKYTNKGGVTIKIKYEKSKIKNINSKLQIIIKDTGMGLEKEQAEDLFNKLFERGEKAQELYTTGRGIGLYTASHLIKEHNGRIWANSEGQGKGSTFYIELPID